MTGKQGEVKSYKGFLLYVLEPMNFAAFMMIDLGHYISLGIIISLILCSVFVLYLRLRPQFGQPYSDQISRFKKDIQGFIESEYKHQSYKLGQDA